MKNFFSLVKIGFNNLFSSSVMHSETKKKGVIILFSFMFLYIFATIFLLAYEIGKLLPASNKSILLTFAMLGSFLFCFISSFFSGTNSLFKSNDSEFLMSLPVKNSVLLGSRLFSSLLYLYFGLIFIYIPFVSSYFIFSQFNFISFVFSIFGFILIPIIPFIIGTILNLLINLFTNTSRFKKLFQYTFIIIILVISIYINFTSSSVISSLITNSESLITTSTIINYSSIFLFNAITKLKALDFFIFVLLSIIPLIVLFLISSKFFNQIYSRLLKTTKFKEFTAINQSTGSYKKALLKKEINKIFSNAMYFFNSCLGPILLFFISVISVFGRKYFVIGNASDTEFLTVLSLITLLLSMSGPLTVSFSLEGANLWILKSSPLPVRQIINTKLLAQNIIFLPPTILSVFIFSINFKFNIVTFITLFVFAIIMCLFCSVIHMWIGIKKVNTSFTSEIQVIKQSSAILYSMLFSFLLSFAIILLYLFILIFCPIFLFTLMLSLILLVLTILIYKYKLNISNERFNNMG